MGNVMSKQVLNGDSASIAAQGQTMNPSPEQIEALKKESAIIPEMTMLGDETITLKGVEKVDGKDAYVIQLTDADKWTGNIVALPNNRVRTTSPALWETGEGVPDFKPSQYIHSAEIHNSYLDPEVTFNNLYSEDK